ncbi:MAG: hypothetical protein WKG00_06825 [Polyangiaceae bacterium]
MAHRCLALAFLASTLVSTMGVGCGGASTEPAMPAKETAAHSGGAAAAGASLGHTEKRLQGKWEIVKYQSDRPIPPEAMPLIGDLFEKMRVEIAGNEATYQTGKSRETHAYSVTQSEGESFKLDAKGGMFDGAECELVSDDEWVVTDRGSTWPGVSTLKRVP